MCSQPTTLRDILPPTLRLPPSRDTTVSLRRAHSQSYTLHREYKCARQYNPYYVHNRREEKQADLINVSTLAWKNDGIRSLLLHKVRVGTPSEEKDHGAR